MKNQYFGAYKLNGKELKEFFSECQFFFDTNTLLNLYRVRKDMAIRIIKTIARQKQRVSIPSHVAYEYHNKVARHHALRLNESQQMQQLCSSPDRLMKKIFSEAFLNYLQQEETGRLKDLIQNFSENVSVFINEKTTEFNDEFKSMEIAYLLSDELSDCVLPALTPETTARLREEFKERAEKGIPPRYKDKTKAKNGETGEQTNEAGDYIIWTEMIKWSTDNGKDVMFICNEEKPDWIWKECGLRIGPRRKLCDEFKEKTGGHRFHIIKLDTFLSLSEDEYSEREIKEIVEETKPEPSQFRKDNIIIAFHKNNESPDYVAMLDHLERIQRDLRRCHKYPKDHKDRKYGPQESTSIQSVKASEKPNQPLKDPKSDKPNT